MLFIVIFEKYTTPEWHAWVIFAVLRMRMISQYSIVVWSVFIIQLPFAILINASNKNAYHPHGKFMSAERFLNNGLDS